MTYIGTAYREYGLVYKGKNFNETRGVASLEECIQMCKDNARCRFWWYEFKNNQRCCLKEGKSGKLVWGPGFVAGNKPWCSKCVKFFLIFSSHLKDTCSSVFFCCMKRCEHFHDHWPNFSSATLSFQSNYVFAEYFLSVLKHQPVT